MSLELLANELLLDLFEYISVVDLSRTFHGLNTRFNTLLFVQFRKYHVDFRSVAKRDFDIVCQRFLPLVIEQIISLHLSDDDESPEQITSFLSHRWILRQFNHLQSLSLYHLRSPEVISTLMTECRSLSHLTHFNLRNCKFQDQDISMCAPLNEIWSLPKLTHCHLDISFNHEGFNVAPSMISRSLQYLFIENCFYGLNALARLLQNTPYLQHLGILHMGFYSKPLIPLTDSSIIILKLSVYRSGHTMKNLLQYMPNLRHLTVNSMEVSMTGDEWQQIIVNYLPKLKVFRLLEFFSLPANDNKEQRINELIDSFRTQFWLQERQWFVRCGWGRSAISDINMIALYTLPCVFPDYHLDEADLESKSTCRHDAYLSYNSVRSLEYELMPSSSSIPLQWCFPNLHNLILRLPIDCKFFLFIPQFNQLKSLKVSLHNADHTLDVQSQLQALLDRAPCLYSLGFDHWPSVSTEMPPFNYSSKSVRRLNLQDVDRFYNSQQCITLSRSPLGIQCEVLSIAVENRTNIIDILSTMTNLRALNVICRDEKRMNVDDNQSSIEEIEIVEWLKYRLPSTCTITKSNEVTIDNELDRSWSCRLWIG